MPRLYTQLKEGGREIRLIQLKARSAGSQLCPSWDPIGCDIFVCSLDDEIRYTTLSYLWGTSTDNREIIVNEFPLAVTPNLWIALDHLRSDDADLILWVDAICINQADLEERTQQVQLMGDIYAGSTRTIAWLGPAAESSDVAIAELRRAGEHMSTVELLMPWFG